MKSWFLPLLILLAGCARHRIEPYSVTPRPMPPLLRAQLGTVLVTATNLAPTFEFRAPNSKSTAVAVGVSDGFRGGGVATAGGIVALSKVQVGGEGGAFLAGSVFVVGAAAGTVGMAAGTVNGLITGVSPGKSRRIEATLETIAARPELQENLRAAVVRSLRETSQSEFRVADNFFGDSGVDAVRATQTNARSIDTLLELRIQQIKVAALRAPHSPLTLDVSASVRFVRVRDGSVIYTGSVGYESTTRYLTDWSTNNGERFNAELGRCTEVLARKIVKSLFELP